MKITKEEKQWWHSEDQHSPNLSKTSLGSFCFAVLTEGAEIGSIWPLAKYPRSWVGVTIKATETQKNAIESKTKFKFKHPPKVHLN